MNFPEDIRLHDNNPRSPFFVEQKIPCDECSQDFYADELAHNDNDNLICESCEKLGENNEIC